MTVERGVVIVTDEHHVAEARRMVTALAGTASLGRVSTFCLATSVSELAHNLVRHATRGGTITIAVLNRNGEIGIEVTAEDDGPGIPDVTLAMQDGFSSIDGLGCGLPGVKRLMDDFEITSTVGTGTRIVARKWQ
jgi:serine/threonine-protein kinase RsbT